MNNLVSVFDSLFSALHTRKYNFPHCLNDVGETFYCSSTPKVEVNDNSYTINIDVPGIERDNLAIELRDNILSISTKKEEKKEREYNERTYSFTFCTPDNVDVSKMNAKMKNGVLTLTLPKKEEQRPKLIPIEVEE